MKNDVFVDSSSTIRSIRVKITFIITQSLTFAERNEFYVVKFQKIYSFLN